MILLGATGMLGTGFREESLDLALQMGATAIGCDAGSADPGPYYLGTGTTARSLQAVKRDLRLLVTAAVRCDVPLVIGSAITAGADQQLELAYRLVQEIVQEQSLNTKVAVIHGEVERQWLLDAVVRGAVRPMPGVPALTTQDIEGSARLVAQMGPEPIIEALDRGAQVVLAGRASDAAIYAALALRNGVPEAMAWHAGKILECGAAVAVQRHYPDCIVADFRDESFAVKLPNPEMTCTPLSVRAHTYYENGDPYLLGEPGGSLDLSRARYEQEPDGWVGVSGAAFARSERYEVRVEGCSLAGYRSIAVGGINDPAILGERESFLGSCIERIHEKVATSLGLRRGGDYDLFIHRYGGGLSEDAEDYPLGVLFESVARSQESAHSVISIAVHTTMHHPVRRWEGFVSNLGLAFSPAVIDVGPAFKWTVNHLVAVDDPLGSFPIDGPIDLETQAAR